jgi:two-component system copper resistance phosphate regulon response regulator CusR
MKILLIEDDIKLSNVLAQGLKEQGMTVEVSRDGLSGLELAMSKTFDAIVLDVMLPARNGFDVLRTLRGSGSASPVLMLTARSGVADRVKGLDLGADDYLPKPFAFKELLARLRAITRRPAAEPQNTLRVADLELDMRTNEVRRGGQAIELTTREFTLLEYMMRHRDTVLTRAMILDQVWDSDYDPMGTSNLVEVYINYLRKKVDQPYSPKLIHTVRGAGYILREKA